MSETLDVLVVGSANVDLVATVPRFPRPGETVRGSDFAIYPGGKGANQAVGVARLGGRVALLGCVGDDGHGRLLKTSLEAAGVDTAGLKTRAGVPTGVALITVDVTGENSIVVLPGANATLTAQEVRDAKELIRAARVVLLQLETTPEAVREALMLARRLGKLTVLNPAPAQQVPKDFLTMPNFLTPNRAEAATLSGKAVRSVAEAEFAAAVLLEQGAENVIVTLGPEGALYVGRGARQLVQAFPVRAMDTTAAGDAFNAALALGLARGLPLEETLVFANATGALASTRRGAQPSLPDLKSVEKLMGRSLVLDS